MREDDNDRIRQSEDDALEPPDDVFNPRRDEEQLAEDGDPPAAPAPNRPNATLPADHPEFDYDRDAHEAYDAGETEAADAANGDEILEDKPTRLPLEPEE